MNHSDEVWSGQEGFANIFAIKDLCSELDTFLGVLKDCGDLDGASPVTVVEALTEDQLLKMSFFQLACLVDNLVVVWNNASLCGLLADDVEIVKVANDLSIDESSWWDISGFISNSEESLAIPEVDHHNCKFHMRAVGRVNLLFQYLSKVLLKKVHLISWHCKHKDDQLFWWGLISGCVSLNDFCCYLNHVFVLISVIIVESHSA